MARAVNKIRHRNIVDVTDYGQENGRFVIVMELLEGETLAQRLEVKPRLEEKAVAGETGDGVLAAILKARQLGASTLVEALIAHLRARVSRAR